MLVAVGRIAKAHGVRGELAVDVRTDSPEQRFAVENVLVARVRGREDKTVTLQAVRGHGDRLLVRFDGVDDRTAADELRGALLLADTDDLPPIEDADEYYDHELAGLTAVLIDGTEVGTVREVVHVPSGELLAIDRSEGETLVPFVQAIVPTVDVANGRVVLDPPEGLLD